MLEILALVFICKSIGNMTRNKGRTPFGYQVMAVVLWFGFEFLGAVAATMVIMIATGTEEPGLLFTYLGALLGAALSVAASFGIVLALPTKIDPYAHIPMDAGPTLPVDGGDQQFRRAI